MLEEMTTNLAITGDATGMLSAYGLGQLVVLIAGACLFFAFAVLMWQFVRIYKAVAWYSETRFAYKAGVIKKHADENNIVLCYEPKRKERGLIQTLDDEIRKDIEEVE